MTIRQNILSKLISDFAKLTTANGYEHDLTAPKIFKNLRAFDENNLPALSVELGADQSEITESGVETNLKAYVYAAYQTDTDLNKEGLLGIEAEKWFSDFDRIFKRPTDSDYDKTKMSELWSVSGVDFYFISVRDPLSDSTKENTAVIAIELTIAILT